MKTAIELKTPSTFYTSGYGAYRWDTYLYSRAAPWFLVTKNVDFDFMRIESGGTINIACAVDDFGNLVRVPA